MIAGRAITSYSQVHRSLNVRINYYCALLSNTFTYNRSSFFSRPWTIRPVLTLTIDYFSHGTLKKEEKKGLKPSTGGNDMPCLISGVIASNQAVGFCRISMGCRWKTGSISWIARFCKGGCCAFAGFDRVGEPDTALFPGVRASTSARLYSLFFKSTVGTRKRPRAWQKLRHLVARTYCDMSVLMRLCCPWSWPTLLPLSCKY